MWITVFKSSRIRKSVMYTSSRTRKSVMYMSSTITMQSECASQACNGGVKRHAHENDFYNIDYEQFYSSMSKKMKPTFLLRANSLLNELPKDTLFKFANGNPNPDTYPFAGITIELKDGSMLKIKDKDLHVATGSMYINGYPPLIKLLQTFQDKLHGSQNWTKKDIIITAGVQDGLFKTLDAFIDDGDAIIVQAPVYPGIFGIIKYKNIECIETECDGYGLCPTYLSNMLQKRKSMNLKMPKFLYLVPVGGNPLGTNLPNERKEKIYELACQYNIIILEDDPYVFLNFEGIETSTSFMSLDTEGRVMRFDSFSKTLGMGFRIGYLTAAKELIRPISMHTEFSDIPTNLGQVVLYKTLEKMGYNGFLAHMSNAREFYYQNFQLTLQSMEKHFKDIAEWVSPQGGVFFWIKLKNIDHISFDFVEACFKKCVLYLPGAIFYAKDRSSPHIRLSYSLIAGEEPEKGLELLAKLIKEEIARKSNGSQKKL